MAPTIIFHTAVTTIENNYVSQKIHIKDIGLLQKCRQGLHVNWKGC